MTEPWEDALDRLERGCERNGKRCINWHTYPYNVCLGCIDDNRFYHHQFSQGTMDAKGTATLRSTIEGLTAERDYWHRRWWIDKHHKWDSCLWNPQAGHFAEWGYADFDAPSCPHWGTRGGGDSGCCATHDEHAACWERAADHYMTDALCDTRPKEDE